MGTAFAMGIAPIAFFFASSIASSIAPIASSILSAAPLAMFIPVVAAPLARLPTPLAAPLAALRAPFAKITLGLCSKAVVARLPAVLVRLLDVSVESSGLQLFSSLNSFSKLCISLLNCFKYDSTSS